jgi:hypothetical protein
MGFPPHPRKWFSIIDYPVLEACSALYKTLPAESTPMVAPMSFMCLNRKERLTTPFPTI